MHPQRIGHDDPLKPELLPENPGDDLVGDGSRSLRRIDLRKREMSGHHRLCSGSNARFEWNKLDRIKPLLIERKNRQSHVSVLLCVTVAGKMFERRNYSFLLQPSNVCLDHPCNPGWDFPKRPRVNNWIVWIVVHICHRRVRPVDPHRARFASRDAAELVGMVGIAGRADCHLRGEQRSPAGNEVGQTLGPAAVQTPRVRVPQT